MRPSREFCLVATAFTWAERSTCSRLSVGAVVHRDGRILTQGYNGAPSGLPHCDYEHSSENCLAVHAEQNAIAFAAKYGVGLDGAGIVVTHQPCLSCARSIINSGIESVLYVQPYRLMDGVSLLLDAGLLVVRHQVDWDAKKLIAWGSDEDYRS